MQVGGRDDGERGSNGEESFGLLSPVEWETSFDGVLPGA